MSVPLDKLYNFINDLCKRHDVLIYRYLPHGSKNPLDVKPLSNFNVHLDNPMMVCHDQEPLDRKYYACFLPSKPQNEYPILKHAVSPSLHRAPLTSYQKMLLLHSETNSQELQWFENHGAVGVFWWSHAIISLDWFRYAKFDLQLSSGSDFTKDFLVYNRAWSGTREYRLKFSEMIVNDNLVGTCHMAFSTLDNDVDYRQYKFKNSDLQISRFDLHEFFPKNSMASTSSADYSSEDYQQCWIDIVLETLFDDDRQHLTEKILRPIACGKPFIALATPGSLQYLRRYGFQTFSKFWDEGYDMIADPNQRLKHVVRLMKILSSLSTQQKIKMQHELSEICDYNRKRFFSEEFFDLVVDEFKDNLEHAMTKMQQHKT